MSFEEEEDISIDYSLSVYPEAIRFRPTFPRIDSHFTLYLINPFSTEETFQLDVDPNLPFYVMSPVVSLQPGSVYSAIITFQTEKPGIYKTNLQISHSNVLLFSIPVIAECYESPLIFDSELIENTVFHAGNPRVSVPIGNKSLKTPLMIVLDTNSTTFSIDPPSLELPPFTSTKIDIIFDPKQKNDVTPEFFLQCPNSGDSITIPLNVTRSNTSAAIDFGVVPIGIRQFRTINLPHLDDIPIAPEPFYLQIMNHDSEDELTIEEYGSSQYDNYCDVVISVCSETPGIYENEVEYGPFSISLKAEIVDQPFKLEFPEDNGKHVVLTNNTRQKRKYHVSFDESFNPKTTIKVVLKPNQAQKIDIIKNNGNIFLRYIANDHVVVQSFEIDNPELIVSQEKIEIPSIIGRTKSHKLDFVNDGDEPLTVQLQAKTNELSLPDDSLIIPPHTSESINVSFTPRSRKHIRGLIEINSPSRRQTIELEGICGLIPSSNFIPFFQIESKNINSYSFTFSGVKFIEIEAPEWIEAPSIAQEAKPLSFICYDCPESTAGSEIALISPDQKEYTLPVIAYRGKSEIHSYMLEPGQLQVFNKGIRPGFVCFSLHDSDNEEILVSPSAAIILPNTSQIFTFDSGESIIMHSGDEILRQIKQFYNPNSFYTVSFDDIETRDEIEKISDTLEQITSKDFSKVFKEYIKVEEIDLTKGVDEEQTFILTQTEVDLGLIAIGETKFVKVWIENITSRHLNLELTAINISPNIKYPMYLKLSPAEDAAITLEFCGNKEEVIDDAILVSDEEYEHEIHVVGEVQSIAAKQEMEIFDFGLCQVGRIARRTLRLSNRKSEDSIVRIQTFPPFSCPVTEVYVESHCFVLLPVHLSPQIEGPVQGVINFYPSSSRAFSIPLIGAGTMEAPPIDDESD